MRRILRRALWGVGAVALLLVLSVGTLFGITFMGNAELKDGQRLGGFAQIVKDGFVSAAVLDMGQGKIALIDAGNDPEAKALLAALARMKRSPKDVVAVFLTHGHQDHVNGLHALRGSRVYGLGSEAALVSGRRKAGSPIAHLMASAPTGHEVTHPMRSGESVQIGDRSVRVFAIPGHTRGSAAYYVDGLVFLGDSADADTDGALTPAKWLFSDDTAQNVKSLAALENWLASEKLAVKQLVFAHTGALSGLGPLSAFNRQHH